MPHHKRSAAPHASLPSIPYCALSVLLLRRAHIQAHVLGRVPLHKEYGLVTAGLHEEAGHLMRPETQLI